MRKILSALILSMLIGLPIALATTNNSFNSQYANNSDGWQLAGGTTSRLLTVTGAAWTLGATTFQAGANTYTLPTSTSTLARTDAAQTFTGIQNFTGGNVGIGSANPGQLLDVQGTVRMTELSIGNTVSTGVTGTGNVVYGTSPSLVTPVLGTPTSVTLNNTSDIIGGVTMTLGSDGTADVYYRNSSGVLTRLGNPGANELLG